MSEENVEIVRGIYTVPDASPGQLRRLAPDVQFDFTSVKGSGDSDLEFLDPKEALEAAGLSE